MKFSAYDDKCFSKTKSQKEIVIGLFQLWHLLFSTDCLFLAYHTSKCYATEFTVLKYSKICYSRSLSLASKEMKNENKIKEQKKKLLGCFLSWVRFLIQELTILCYAEFF